MVTDGVQVGLRWRFEGRRLCWLGSGGDLEKASTAGGTDFVWVGQGWRSGDRKLMVFLLGRGIGLETGWTAVGW